MRKSHIERGYFRSQPEAVANASSQLRTGAEPKRVEEALSDILGRAPRIFL
jgi:hypothetical protein